MRTVFHGNLPVNTSPDPNLGNSAIFPLFVSPPGQAAGMRLKGICSKLNSVYTGLFRVFSGRVRTGQDRTGQDRTGQDRTGQYIIPDLHWPEGIFQLPVTRYNHFLKRFHAVS